MNYFCSNVYFNRPLLAAIGLLCSGVMGCGSSEISPYERFERLPSVAELVTIELGEYVVPVPIEPSGNMSLLAANQMQIEFLLHAAVLPEHERTLRNNYERLEGRFRDNIIAVCRNAPVEDLLDPGFTSLKSHLADAMKPYIGDARIERIHIADPQVKRL